VRRRILWILVAKLLQVQFSNHILQVRIESFHLLQRTPLLSWKIRPQKIRRPRVLSAERNLTPELKSSDIFSRSMRRRPIMIPVGSVRITRTRIVRINRPQKLNVTTPTTSNAFSSAPPSPQVLGSDLSLGIRQKSPHRTRHWSQPTSGPRVAFQFPFGFWP
jgi:hypothetical protein